MAAKGYRMSGQGGWWTAFSSAGAPTCSASVKVEDEEALGLISKTVRNMTLEGVIGAMVVTGLFVASHSIPT